MNINLGIVRIEYNAEGVVISASFKPAEFKHFDKRLLQQLKDIQNDRDERKVQYNAEMIFADWVSQMGNVDLTDLMYEKKLESKVLDCQKFEDGMVKICEMEFWLEDN